MENKTRTQITSAFFVAFSVVFSFLFWFSVEKIVTTLETEAWSQPVVFFSAFFISWSLGIILAKDNGWLRLASLLPLITGICFVLNWKHLVMIVLAGLLTWLAIIYIKKEIDSRTSISIWNSLRVGRRFFIIAIALIVASHYYFNHSQLSETGDAPKIKLGQQQAWLATKIISAIDPDLKASEMDDLTIDDFIKRKVDIESQSQALQIEEQIRNEGDIPNGLWDGLTGGINIEELEEEIILQENRKGISEIAGKEVEGNEKMIDVVSDIINSKINEIFSSKKGFNGPTGLLIPWLLTLVLFLTVASFGVFVSPLLIFIVWVLFKILIGFKLVTIEKKETMMEIII